MLKVHLVRRTINTPPRGDQCCLLKFKLDPMLLIHAAHFSFTNSRAATPGPKPALTPRLMIRLGSHPRWACTSEAHICLFSGLHDPSSAPRCYRLLRSILC